MPSVHPLTGTELRALRRLQREQEPGRYVFVSERDAPMTAVAFRRMLTRLGEGARMPFPIHPHMLRHACGFKLANQGVDTRSLQHYLGHKNIQHTVRYTELSLTGSGIFGRTRERLMAKWSRPDDVDCLRVRFRGEAEMAASPSAADHDAIDPLRTSAA